MAKNRSFFKVRFYKENKYLNTHKVLMNTLKKKTPQI